MELPGLEPLAASCVVFTGIADEGNGITPAMAEGHGRVRRILRESRAEGGEAAEDGELLLRPRCFGLPEAACQPISPHGQGLGLSGGRAKLRGI